MKIPVFYLLPLVGLLAGSTTNTQANQRLGAAPASAHLLAATTALEPVVGVQQSARDLTGTVLSESGQPLAGATVTIVGEKLQSSTNSAGTYVLHSTAPAPVLHVSYAGYEDAQQVMEGSEPLTFKLKAIEKYKRQLKKRSKAAHKAWRH